MENKYEGDEIDKSPFMEPGLNETLSRIEVSQPVYDRNLFLFSFGMFFSVQQNFCQKKGAVNSETEISV